LKRVALALGLLALAAYGSLAFLVLRARSDPERFGPPGGAWILGPSGGDLERAAERKVADALDVLGGRTGATAAGLAAYREHLLAARALFVRALRARPFDPRSIARLAAVRWEIEAPEAVGLPRAPLELISVSARMAPDSPAIQALLGELLLRIGLKDDAVARLRRGVELDPTVASRAVLGLRGSFFAAEQILGALPPIPEVLVALETAFFDEGKESRYLAALEESIRNGASRLVPVYGRACLRAKDPDRLLRTLASLPAPTDREDEVERLVARSRARLETGEKKEAQEDARRARSLLPEEPRILENLGRVSLAAGDADAAVAAYREALGRVARGAGVPAARARLYRAIGEAEERRGRADRAYDAYRKALELDPRESHAGKRVTQMEKAAGLVESPPKGPER